MQILVKYEDEENGLIVLLKHTQYKYEIKQVKDTRVVLKGFSNDLREAEQIIDTLIDKLLIEH